MKDVEWVFLFLSLFMNKRQCVLVHEEGKGRERGRDRIPNRLCAVSAEPNVGLDTGLDVGCDPTNCEIMT